MKKFVIVLTALMSLAAYADNTMPGTPDMNAAAQNAQSQAQGAANQAQTQTQGAATQAQGAAQAQGQTLQDKANASATKAQSLGAKLNINTASEEDLATLPGIGPTKAKAIVAGRPYAKPADLMKVKGIKGAVYAKIKNKITTN